MSFPSRSPFYNQPSPPLAHRSHESPHPRDAPHVQEPRWAGIRTTSIPTSDLEDIEFDLRDLAYRAGSPEDARIFEDFANKLSSYYKG